MRRASLRSAVLFVAASMVTVAPAARGGSVTVSGTIRDFHGSFSSTSPFARETNGHPDFEVFTIDPNNPLGPTRIPAGFGGAGGVQSQIDAVEPGIVGPTIGADHKPVWVGGTNSALVATTKMRYNAAGDNLEAETDDNASRSNFNQWFNDTPNINSSKPFDIKLDDPENDGTFTYSNNSFFPIDNQLFGNEGRAHNQHFTVELHSDFTSRPGQVFSFTGDDDVWAFINNQRVIDLGGVHKALSATVNLDDLGLTAGKKYTVDFFFAERNTFESHFRIDSNLTLGAVTPPPTGVPLPPAVLPGMALLAGLAGIGGAGRLRRRHA